MPVVVNEGGGAVASRRNGVRLAAAAGRIRDAFDRLWRSLAQVMMFGVFGLGGAAMTLLVGPVLFLFVRNPQTRTAVARRCVKALLLGYTGAMHALRLIRLELEGREHLQHRGVVIVANHPTLIDAFFLLGRVDRLVPVAKRALLANPFTSGAIRAANYLVYDEGPLLVEACRERLRRGESLLLFPEGTRTGTDGRIRLRRGAAQVAVRCGCPVVPVTVAVTERFLTRSSPWWLASRTRPTVRITAFAPVDPAPFFAASTSPALATRRLTEHLEQFYSRELPARGSV